MNKSTKAPEAPKENASVWLQVRVKESDKDRWKAEAAKQGVSLSKLVVARMNGLFRG